MREAFKPNGILATLRIVHHSQVLQHGLRIVGHSKASVGVKGKDIIHGGEVDSAVGDVDDDEYNGEEAEGEGEGSEGANTLASAMEQAMGECGQVPPFDEFQIYTDAWWGEAATPFYVSLDVWWWSELVGLSPHLSPLSHLQNASYADIYLLYRCGGLYGQRTNVTASHPSPPNAHHPPISLSRKSTFPLASGSPTHRPVPAPVPTGHPSGLAQLWSTILRSKVSTPSPSLLPRLSLPTLFLLLPTNSSLP